MSGCWGVIRGYLYADPIEKVSQGGTKYVSARLKVKDKDKTVFWSVSAFDEGAKQLLAYKAGEGVTCEGSVRGSTYVDKNGATQIGFAIMTRLVQSYEPKQGGQRASQSLSPNETAKPVHPAMPTRGHTGLDDDIPFAPEWR